MNWSDYLTGFHQESPGITEEVLGRTDAYPWLLQAVPPQGRVLDLACGSAPLWALPGRARLRGIDSSPTELAADRARGAGPLVEGSADALPFADSSFPVVICSMALQILTPLQTVLAEAARVNAALPVPLRRITATPA